MRRRTVAFQLACLAVLSLFQHSAAGGQLSQTQSTSSRLVATDWGPGTSGITDPLTFAQFNPSLGTLTAIDITLTTTIRNDYILTFLNTPIPTTLYVATSATSDPSVLADPAKRALLTDGPTVTVYGPNGSSTQIFGAPATTLPVDFVQMTETSGTFSSLSGHQSQLHSPNDRHHRTRVRWTRRMRPHCSLISSGRAPSTCPSRRRPSRAFSRVAGMVVEPYSRTPTPPSRSSTSSPRFRFLSPRAPSCWVWELA